MQVLITGATGGIGFAIATEFAQAGHQVILADLQQSTIDNKVAELNAQGFTAAGLQLDVTDAAAVDALSAQYQIDVLVNNAGILFPQTSIEGLTAERINRVLATNVTGYFLCSREAVKRMALRHGGHGGAIVNVSSAASRLGAPGEYLDYAASKGAIDTLTIGLSLEVAAEGIRVNGVRPGVIYTDIHASGGEPGRVDRIQSLLPMKRGGHPHEVAEAIVWLLSDCASYVTGSVLDLAGGK